MRKTHIWYEKGILGTTYFCGKCQNKVEIGFKKCIECRSRLNWDEQRVIFYKHRSRFKT